jgi:hypothetical protein
MDPRRTAIISGSLNSYRHEMLMENARGIPLQQQHGEIDDNVPAYNSRFLSQMLFQAGTNSSYNEVPGQNHWWDTVMTTPQLVDFYYKHTASNETIPRVLKEFSIVIGDPGDMGSKGGITILNLEDPGQYGKVDVKGHVITTSNVLSLELDPVLWKQGIVTIDGQELELGESLSISRRTVSWEAAPLQEVGKDVLYRHGRQLGAMTAILRTNGSFVIRHHSGQNAHVALQVSRNLHQYFSADSVIVSGPSWSSSPSETGNVISLAIGGEVPPSLHPDFPIAVGAAGVSVRDSKGHHHDFNQGGSLGAAFLRPLDGERLELVLWGSDSHGLALAARLVPMLTGVGQPDFLVLGESTRWRGVEGALALGFFDHEWAVTPSSVVQ